MIFFHGNAEDVNLSRIFLEDVVNTLQINVLAVEYPGYGVYQGVSCSADAICDDALFVYRQVKERIRWPEEDIIVMGRSIGSGPACHVAAANKPGLLFLMSAYTSICGVVKDVAGTLSSWFVKERFRNIEKIREMKCPVLLIHGRDDTLIRPHHSEELKAACKERCDIYIRPNMTHNDFRMGEDILSPMLTFLKSTNHMSDSTKVKQYKSEDIARFLAI
jgi:fermentation-respiration switch protein FrsA (DUF1100 family)